MKADNYIKLEFPSRSANEGFARAAAAAFAAQLDPTMDVSSMDTPLYGNNLFL